MKSILLLIAVIAIAVPAQAALEGGDLVVKGEIIAQPNPTRTPNVTTLFLLKQSGALETLVSDNSKFQSSGGYGYGYTGVQGIAVRPDGSGVVVAYAGNWDGGPTPTPYPTPTWWVGQPTATPVPMSYWRQSALYNVAKDGSVSTILEGGALSPSTTSSSISSVACDSSGNIYVLHNSYEYPSPTPLVGQAILKIAGAAASDKGAVTTSVFLSPWNAAFPDDEDFQDDIAVDPNGNLIVSKGAHNYTPYPLVTDATPTPRPAAIYKADPQGNVTELASADLKTWLRPLGALDFWSEPFDDVYPIGFNVAGNLVFNGRWYDDYVDKYYSRLIALGSINILGDTTNGWWPDCIDGAGRYVEFVGSDTVILDASGKVIDYLIQNDPVNNLSYGVYNPAEKPLLTPFFDKEMFATGESLSVGFGLARGVKDNDVDIYLAIQHPTSGKGTTIELLNPNAATNHLPVLIPLDTAKKYPTQISKLRYGNGTTSVKGNGMVTVKTFQNVRGIPAGTIKLLGVITPTGSNLFDTSKWLTPNKKPVEAETFFTDAI